LTRLSRDLVEQFRNLLIARLLAASTAAAPIKGQQTEYLLDLPDEEIADLTAQANGIAVETLLDYLNFMAAGDEEVARSANPRFALEAALVRLATLPKSLPVADLIERLEAVEGKFPAGGRSVAPPQRTEPPRAALVTEAAKVPLNRVGDKDAAWREFVGFVSKQKRFLGSHLESAVLLDLSPGQLKIGVAERHHLNYLQDTENFSALKALAKQLFSEELTITVAAMEADSLPKTEAAPAAPYGGSEGKSEMVKEALRIFGGAVKSVRRETS